jgi:hypothetical protein
MTQMALRIFSHLSQSTHFSLRSFETILNHDSTDFPECGVLIDQALSWHFRFTRSFPSGCFQLHPMQISEKLKVKGKNRADYYLIFQIRRDILTPCRSSVCIDTNASIRARACSFSHRGWDVSNLQFILIKLFYSDCCTNCDSQFGMKK